jgi:hypothetical protein
MFKEEVRDIGMDIIGLTLLLEERAMKFLLEPLFHLIKLDADIFMFNLHILMQESNGN